MARGARSRRGEGKRRGGGRGAAEDDVWLSGRHLVRETLEAGTWPLRRVLVEDGLTGDEIELLVRLAESRRIRIERAPRATLDDLAGAGVGRHQGVAALAGAFPYVALDEAIARDRAAGREPLVLLLDHLHDPHNFGAILRSADGAGVTCVAIPPRRQVGLTAVVARTSAGAVNWVPIAQVSNLAATIRQLEEDGFWVYGAAAGGERTVYDLDLTGAVAFVIGGEGEGLRDLTTKRCDEVVSIPLAGKVESLNASVAAALMLFEAARQRRSAPGKGEQG